MLRHTSLFILLSVSLIVVAQPLYKWVEPDGSITFSPVKPPKGTEYEIVSQAVDKNLSDTAGTQLLPDAPMPQPSQALPAQTITSAAGGQTEESGTLIDKQSRPASSLEPSLHREAGAMIERSSLQPGVEEPGNESASEALRNQPATADQANSIQLAPARLTEIAQPSRKQRQCQDLQKRVISLERRLKSRLTPEDMDNTVVHMARYQRSFDQHCVQ